MYPMNEIFNPVIQGFGTCNDALDAMLRSAANRRAGTNDFRTEPVD